MLPWQKNNFLELNKVTLVEWLKKSFATIFEKKKHQI
jgi:hypothetical protein